MFRGLSEKAVLRFALGSCLMAHSQDGGGAFASGGNSSSRKGTFQIDLVNFRGQAEIIEDSLL